MWTLITSDGRLLPNIGSEEEARRTVHTLGITQLRGPFSWDVVDDHGRRFVAEIKHRPGVRLDMIVGRTPRMPVIGDTVLSRVDHTRGAGIIVGADAVRYKVYWRDGRDTLRWHARRELTVPRIDYGDGLMQPSASDARANNVLES